MQPKLRAFVCNVIIQSVQTELAGTWPPHASFLCLSLLDYFYGGDSELYTCTKINFKFKLQNISVAEPR